MDAPSVETDPRFPSGKWVGFFLDKRMPGKHGMELVLNFSQGIMTGDGRDKVGDFVIRGKYQLEDGKCWWTKRYVGKHDVFYEGFNEGKGIWGSWQLSLEASGGLSVHGGFHIWPENMADPTGDALREEAEAPVDDLVPV